MAHHKIDYVELPASDLHAIKAFYQAAFGWRFIDYGDEYCALDGAGLDGGFFKAPLSSSTANGAALVVLYSEDLEASQQAVEQAGGTIIKPIFSFPGGRRFQFTDPCGNELAVWSHT
ncbi:glyoxalase/dioxygenase superfamily protein [gamma proteobacterium HTCC5015]|nr:glyoxalase/dioxygenase superfamily protein [gamma proteobacterium HTCC5015]